jgi:hypothetical protein
MNIRLVTLLAIALSFSSGLYGCGIGYNRMLFVTKTNVGFEIDSKPPSLQLDINRLEGVFAPQFEGGKKLPVMSSFKFGTESAFSPSVGSAFATGDAAVVLASLYGDKTPEGDWLSRLKLITDGKKVDSSLAFDRKPIIRKSWLTWLATLFEPGDFQEDDVRPVFFGTDTSLGIKVAWSGTSSYIPDTARLGYARKELAWVPITIEEKSEAPQKPYRVKTSSLLATLDFGMQAPSIDIKKGASAPINYVQYFATGDAATLLSVQQTVRRAMLTRLDPNASKRAREFAAGLAGEAKIQSAVYLATVYNALVMNAGKDKEDALRNGLDMISQRLPESQTLYKWSADEKLLEQETKLLRPPDQRKFDDVSIYWKKTYDSVNWLQAIVDEIEADPKFAFQEQVGAEKPVDVTSERKEQLKIEFKKMKDSFDDFDKKLRSNPAVIDAVTYIMDTMLPSK